MGASVIAMDCHSSLEYIPTKCWSVGWGYFYKDLRVSNPITALNFMTDLKALEIYDVSDGC